jgi:hypothetical protein
MYSGKEHLPVGYRSQEFDAIFEHGGYGQLLNGDGSVNRGNPQSLVDHAIPIQGNAFKAKKAARFPVRLDEQLLVSISYIPAEIMKVVR